MLGTLEATETMIKKRFTCEVTDTDLCHIETITDNFEMNTFDDIETVTELLNKFSEEKEQLKKENKYLMDVIFAMKDYSAMDDYKSIINAVNAVEQNISRGDF